MTNTYRPILSRGARVAIALAVASFVAAAWLAAGHESRRAVLVATTAIEGPTYVTLPAVEVVARRQPSTDTAWAAL
jgi:hypothetical protein